MVSIDPPQESSESPTANDMMARTNQRIDDLRTDMNQRIDDLRADMNQRIDDLRADMNQRFTIMVALMIAMIGLLGGIIALVA